MTLAGLRSGYGHMTYASSNDFPLVSIYTGNFENGIRQGTGVYICSATNLKYEGDWENDLAHGFGRIEWEDGAVYAGKMGRGRLVKGSYTFPSGSFFEGNFDELSGMFLGEGTFQNNDEIVTGTWKDGKLNGKGERKMRNGDYYQGIWVEDNLEG